MTRMFNESDVGRLFFLIREHALDRRKQNALYKDDWPTVVAEDFAGVHVDSVFKIAGEACAAGGAIARFRKFAEKIVAKM